MRQNIIISYGSQNNDGCGYINVIALKIVNSERTNILLDEKIICYFILWYLFYRIIYDTTNSKISETFVIQRNLLKKY